MCVRKEDPLAHECEATLEPTPAAENRLRNRPPIADRQEPRPVSITRNVHYADIDRKPRPVSLLLMIRVALRFTPAPAHYLLGATYVVAQLIRSGYSLNRS